MHIRRCCVDPALDHTFHRGKGVRLRLRYGMVGADEHDDRCRACHACVLIRRVVRVTRRVERSGKRMRKTRAATPKHARTSIAMPRNDSLQCRQSVRVAHENECVAGAFEPRRQSLGPQIANEVRRDALLAVCIAHPLRTVTGHAALLGERGRHDRTLEVARTHRRRDLRSRMAAPDAVDLLERESREARPPAARRRLHAPSRFAARNFSRADIERDPCVVRRCDAVPAYGERTVSLREGGRGIERAREVVCDDADRRGDHGHYVRSASMTCTSMPASRNGASAAEAARDVVTSADTSAARQMSANAGAPNLV